MKKARLLDTTDNPRGATVSARMRCKHGWETDNHWCPTCVAEFIRERDGANARAERLEKLAEQLLVTWTDEASENGLPHDMEEALEDLEDELHPERNAILAAEKAGGDE